ncbi:MAG: hypothetical protein LQ342_004793 [Letrouitia transgressa]|nr:MAG: hypothetical protein LQ342_004793 [Letrouitia transgressa]
MNVACLISVHGIDNGAGSPLCQFQAFLIQMFLGVDAFWSLCMAWNVYLAFFHKYTAKQLRALDKWYLLGCYGAAFVPALTFLFVDTQRRGKIYGPAILWCWIDIKWDFLRIALLYGIVWIAILFAAVIYFKAGRVIWERREQLEGFLNPFNENPFAGIITTEINVTYEASRSNPDGLSRSPDDNDVHRGQPDAFDPYTVNVEVGERPKETSGSKPDIFRVRSLTRTAAMNESMNPGAWFVNRAYALVHPDRVNFGLNYVSALVLPMQGLINVIVYVITSQTATQNLWYSIWNLRSFPSGSRNGKSSTDSSTLDVKLERFGTRRTSHRLGSDMSVSVPSETHSPK